MLPRRRKIDNEDDFEEDDEDWEELFNEECDRYYKDTDLDNTRQSHGRWIPDSDNQFVRRKRIR